MRLEEFFTPFQNCFRTRTRDNSSIALSFTKGLLQANRQDLDEVNQLVPGINYHQLQHFVSDSPWSSQQLMDKVSLQVDSGLFGGEKLLIIDEVSVPKKGDHSVGVSRQYCGTRGKIENCQVGVAGYLTDFQKGSLVDMRLYFPKKWFEEEGKLKRAGIAPGTIQYQGKREIAIEIMKHQLEIGTDFDWVVADSFYGQDLSVVGAVTEMGKNYLLEVLSNRNAFFSEPIISIPKRKIKSGKAPSVPRPNIKPVSIKSYVEQLPSKAFKKVRIRNTFKGRLLAQVHICDIWFIDRHSRKLVKSRLLIRKNKHKLKLALTNAGDQSAREVVKVQAWRYFIERSFQEAKNVVGMKYYQIRKYLAWSHYMAIIIMILFFMNQEQTRCRIIHPLISLRDLKLLLQYLLPTKMENLQDVLASIEYNLVMKERDYRRFNPNVLK